MRRAEALGAGRGVGYDAMMLAAGRAVAESVQRHWTKRPVLVLCGPGNNGGDGFIAAEALRLAGWPVRVAALPSGSSSDAASVARASWRGETVAFAPGSLEGIGLVVDALFGTGIARPLEGDAALMVESMNTQVVPVLAVDLPSGVETDTGVVFEPAVAAEVTVTFFRKKPAHLLLPASLRCGLVEIADIGLVDDVLDEINPLTAENTAPLWSSVLPEPRAGGHKFDRGHALLYGGSMTGAGRLAARSAQRMGAGLVTLVASEAAYPVYAAALESAIVKAEQKDLWREELQDTRPNALLIGPGLGLDPANKPRVLAALATGKACVLDADGLSLFADAPELLFAALHEKCVLTPHEGEFARLFGDIAAAGEDKLTRARKAALKTGSVVLLKGSDTVIAESSGACVVNRNAPPWLATAGAGDVLAGMILGLLAQGVGGFQAACAAVALHGAIANRFGIGLIAEDLVDGIPQILQETKRKAF